MQKNVCRRSLICFHSGGRFWGFSIKFFELTTRLQPIRCQKVMRPKTHPRKIIFGASPYGRLQGAQRQCYFFCVFPLRSPDNDCVARFARSLAHFSGWIAEACHWSSLAHLPDGPGSVPGSVVNFPIILVSKTSSSYNVVQFMATFSYWVKKREGNWKNWISENGKEKGAQSFHVDIRFLWLSGYSLWVWMCVVSGWTPDVCGSDGKGKRGRIWSMQGGWVGGWDGRIRIRRGSSKQGWRGVWKRSIRGGRNK